MIAGMLIHRATIRRDSPVDDGAGGWSANLVTIASNVRCRMRSMKLSEIVTAAQRTPQITNRLYFLPTQDVKVADVVDCNGAHLRVETLNTPSQPGSHIEVDCAQMPPAIQNEGEQ